MQKVSLAFSTAKSLIFIRLNFPTTHHLFITPIKKIRRREVPTTTECKMKTKTKTRSSNCVGAYHRGAPYLSEGTHLQFPTQVAAHQFYLDQMPTGSPTLHRDTFKKRLRKTGFILPFPQGHQRHGLAFLFVETATLPYLADRMTGQVSDRTYAEESAVNDGPNAAPCDPTTTVVHGDDRQTFESTSDAANHIAEITGFQLSKVVNQLRCRQFRFAEQSYTFAGPAEENEAAAKASKWWEPLSQPQHSAREVDVTVVMYDGSGIETSRSEYGAADGMEVVVALTGGQFTTIKTYLYVDGGVHFEAAGAKGVMYPSADEDGEKDAQKLPVYKPMKRAGHPLHGTVIPKCKAEGCSNFVIRGELCISHGKCKAEGCTNFAIRDGRCVSHTNTANTKKRPKTCKASSRRNVQLARLLAPLPGPKEANAANAVALAEAKRKFAEAKRKSDLDWSHGEDKELVNFCEIHGAHNWLKIAESMSTNRSPADCAIRFTHFLAPYDSFFRYAAQYGECWARYYYEEEHTPPPGTRNPYVANPRAM